MTEAMRKRFPSITSIDLESDGNTSFLRAARNGQLDKVLEHLKTNIDINTSNANGLNALHLASKDGHVDIVKELLKRGAIVDAATKKGNTALHIASLAGQEEVVKLLVQNGASVNVQSQNGFTPLYMAAQENHDNVVKYLLGNGANQSLSTEDGFTPLAVAMQQGHDKVVAVLLENDTRGKVRLPALHIAAKKDDVKAAKLLLENEHNPDVTSKSGFTPLHIASHYGNQQIANLLIQKGADVNYAAKHNITPLHVAAKWGKTNMVALLLENGASIEAKTRDGLTPLHCAARSGHEQVVDMLLEKGAPLSSKTKNGLAPLHMAAQGDHVDAARILLFHRAPVDEVTVDYLTALHVAAHCGHVRVAKLLLDRQADANARALNGFTPLHIACKKNRIKVVELLLKHGASIGATTESGLTPLHVASFMGCMNIVIYLLQHDANPDVPTVRGETPLHLAARANQTDIIRILLRNGAQVDARAREQQTPLHIASRLGNVDIVMLLLQHGAKVDSATKDMYTALHIAAKEGQDEVAGVLIENGASINATTKKGFTPLHLASKYGHLKVAKLLLQKEAPVDAQGKNGVTPLHVAAHYDHQNVALLLLDKGASPNATAKNGHTPLHIAARKNQMDIANTLLEYGAPANAESKAGFTPLHLGAQEGHTDMAALLLEHNANANYESKNGLTPLHLCAQEDRVPVAEILVKNGASVNSVTKAGYTPLHMACHYGQANMVRFLLKKGADINSTTQLGYTPLHQAAQQGHTNIVNVLLEHKADPNAETTNGQTPLQIAQKLGYITVIESLKVVTTVSDITTNTTTTIEEKYKVQAPEAMQETFMSDSEEEGGEEAVLGDQTYRYLTADEMKSLGDDSLPIDVTRDERIDSNRMVSSTDSNLPPQHIEDSISPEHISKNYVDYVKKYSPDNVDIARHPINIGFLVSFLVDARGGAMRGCRHSGVRVIVPPRCAPSPTRITCRYVRPQRTPHPPPLMEGEALASRVLELGPVGSKFLGPVIIEVPHFAALRGREREIVILRSDNGESWKEHAVDATDEVLNKMLHDSFEAEDLNQMEDIASGRITRIVTQDFPQYFAVVSRIRQEVHAIGPEGGMVSSTVVPQVQAIFPEGALTKKIKVGLQAQPIDPELTAKLLGHGVAVSPVVTVEPRRRKFHKAIRLNMPAPTAHSQGMINQYSGSAPTLRLLCSITGGTSRAQWEDVTGSTPLTFVNDVVSFTTTVSARFWLMDCRNIGDATKMATELYKEAIHVPFMAKFVVFAKRVDPLEARLRVFCMTDDKEDKTLEHQEHFTEVAKSRDVEVLEGKPQYVEFAGNLVSITKTGEQLQFSFRAFRENRLPFSVRVKDQHAEAVGRCLFMKEARVLKGELPQQPICILNIVLPEDIVLDTISLTDSETSKRHMYLSEFHDYYRPDTRLADMSNLLGEDWVELAHQLGLTESEINVIKSEYPESRAKQAQSMLRMWLSQSGNMAQTNTLENALRRIGREDIIPQCLNVDQPSYISRITKEEEVGYRLKKDSDREKRSRKEDEFSSPDKKKLIEHYDKYSAEEKVFIKSESEEEEDTFDKTVTERREVIQKRLSAERQIPASSQRREIVEEIKDIKRQSIVEDTLENVKQKGVDPQLIDVKPVTKKAVVSETIEIKTTLPSDSNVFENDLPNGKHVITKEVMKTHKIITERTTTSHKTQGDTQLLEGVTQRFEGSTRTNEPRFVGSEDPKSPKFSMTPPPSPADFLLQNKEATSIQEWDARKPPISREAALLENAATEQGKTTTTTLYRLDSNEDISLIKKPVIYEYNVLAADRYTIDKLKPILNQTNAFIHSESRAEPYHPHTEKIYKITVAPELPKTEEKKSKRGFFGTLKTFVGKSSDVSDSDSERTAKKEKNRKKKKKGEVQPEVPQRPPRKPRLPTPKIEHKNYDDIPFFEADDEEEPPSYTQPPVPLKKLQIPNQKNETTMVTVTQRKTPEKASKYKLMLGSAESITHQEKTKSPKTPRSEKKQIKETVISSQEIPVSELDVSTSSRVRTILSSTEKLNRRSRSKSPKRPPKSPKKNTIIIVDEFVTKTFAPAAVEEDEFTIVVDPTKKTSQKKSIETYVVNIEKDIKKIETEISDRYSLPKEQMVKPVPDTLESPTRPPRAKNHYEDVDSPIASPKPDHLVSIPEPLQFNRKHIKKVTTDLIENEQIHNAWIDDKILKPQSPKKNVEMPKRTKKRFGLFKKSSKDTDGSEDESSSGKYEIRSSNRDKSRERSADRKSNSPKREKSRERSAERKGFKGIFGKKAKDGEESPKKETLSQDAIESIRRSDDFLKTENIKYYDSKPVILKSEITVKTIPVKTEVTKSQKSLEKSTQPELPQTTRQGSPTKDKKGETISSEENVRNMQHTDNFLTKEVDVRPAVQKQIIRVSDFKQEMFENIDDTQTVNPGVAEVIDPSVKGNRDTNEAVQISMNQSDDFLKQEVDKYHDIWPVKTEPRQDNKLDEPDTKKKEVKGIFDVFKKKSEKDSDMSEDESSGKHDAKSPKINKSGNHSTDKKVKPSKREKSRERSTERKGFKGFFGKKLKDGKKSPTKEKPALNPEVIELMRHSDDFLKTETDKYNDCRPVIPKPENIVKTVPATTQLIKSKEKTKNQELSAKSTVKPKTIKSLTKDYKEKHVVDNIVQNIQDTDNFLTKEVDIYYDASPAIQKHKQKIFDQVIEVTEKIEHTKISSQNPTNTQFLEITEVIEPNDVTVEESETSSNVIRMTEFNKTVKQSIKQSDDFLKEEVNKHHDVWPLKTVLREETKLEESDNKKRGAKNIFGIFKKKSEKDIEKMSHESSEKHDTDKKSLKKEKSRVRSTDRIKREKSRERSAERKSLKALFGTTSKDDETSLTKENPVKTQEVIKLMKQSSDFLKTETDKYHDCKPVVTTPKTLIRTSPIEIQSMEKSKKPKSSIEQEFCDPHQVTNISDSDLNHLRQTIEVTENIQPKKTIIQDTAQTQFIEITQVIEPREVTIDISKTISEVRNMHNLNDLLKISTLQTDNFLKNEVDKYYDVRPIVTKATKEPILDEPDTKKKESKGIFGIFKKKPGIELKLKGETLEFSQEVIQSMQQSKDFLKDEVQYFHDVQPAMTEIKQKTEKSSTKPEIIKRTKPVKERSSPSKNKETDSPGLLSKFKKTTKSLERSQQLILSDEVKQDMLTSGEFLNTEIKKFYDIKPVISPKKNIEDTTQKDHRQKDQSSIFGLFKKKSLSLERDQKRLQLSKEVTKCIKDSSDFLKKEVDLFYDVKPIITTEKEAPLVEGCQQKEPTGLFGIFKKKPEKEQNKSRSLERGQKIILSDEVKKHMLDSGNFLRTEVDVYHDVNLINKKYLILKDQKQNESSGLFSIFKKKDKKKASSLERDLKLPSEETLSVFEKNDVFLKAEQEKFHDIKPVVTVKSDSEMLKQGIKITESIKPAKTVNKDSTQRQIMDITETIKPASKVTKTMSDITNQVDKNISEEEESVKRSIQKLDDFLKQEIDKHHDVRPIVKKKLSEQKMDEDYLKTKEPKGLFGVFKKKDKSESLEKGKKPIPSDEVLKKMKENDTFLKVEVGTFHDVRPVVKAKDIVHKNFVIGQHGNVTQSIDLTKPVNKGSIKIQFTENTEPAKPAVKVIVQISEIESKAINPEIEELPKESITQFNDFLKQEVERYQDVRLITKLSSPEKNIEEDDTKKRESKAIFHIFQKKSSEQKLATSEEVLKQMKESDTFLKAEVKKFHDVRPTVTAKKIVEEKPIEKPHKQKESSGLFGILKKRPKYDQTKSKSLEGDLKIFFSEEVKQNMLNSDNFLKTELDKFYDVKPVTKIQQAAPEQKQKEPAGVFSIFKSKDKRKSSSLEREQKLPSEAKTVESDPKIINKTIKIDKTIGPAKTTIQDPSKTHFMKVTEIVEPTGKVTAQISEITSQSIETISEWDTSVKKSTELSDDFLKQEVYIHHGVRPDIKQDEKNKIMDDETKKKDHKGVFGMFKKKDKLSSLDKEQKVGSSDEILKELKESKGFLSTEVEKFYDVKLVAKTKDSAAPEIKSFTEKVLLPNEENKSVAISAIFKKKSASMEKGQQKSKSLESDLKLEDEVTVEDKKDSTDFLRQEIRKYHDVRPEVKSIEIKEKVPHKENKSIFGIFMKKEGSIEKNQNKCKSLQPKTEHETVIKNMKESDDLLKQEVQMYHDVRPIIKSFLKETSDIKHQVEKVLTNHEIPKHTKTETINLAVQNLKNMKDTNTFLKQEIIIYQDVRPMVTTKIPEIRQVEENIKKETKSKTLFEIFKNKSASDVKEPDLKKQAIDRNEKQESDIFLKQEIKNFHDVKPVIKEKPSTITEILVTEKCSSHTESSKEKPVLSEKLLQDIQNCNKFLQTEIKKFHDVRPAQKVAEIITIKEKQPKEHKGIFGGLFKTKRDHKDKAKLSDKIFKQMEQSDSFLREEVNKYYDSSSAISQSADTKTLVKVAKKESFKKEFIGSPKIIKEDSLGEKETKGLLSLFAKKGKYEDIEAKLKHQNALQNIKHSNNFLKQEIDKFHDVRPEIQRHLFIEDLQKEPLRPERKNQVKLNLQESNKGDLSEQFLKDIQNSHQFLTIEINEYYDAKPTMPKEMNTTREATKALPKSHTVEKTKNNFSPEMKKAMKDSHSFLTQEVDKYHDAKFCPKYEIKCEAKVDKEKKSNWESSKKEDKSKKDKSILGIFKKKKKQHDTLTKEGPQICEETYRNIINSNEFLKEEVQKYHDVKPIKLSIHENLTGNKIIEVTKEVESIPKTTKFLTTELTAYEDSKNSDIRPALSEGVLLHMITSNNFLREEINRFHDVRLLRKPTPEKELLKEKTKLFGIFGKKKSHDKKEPEKLKKEKKIKNQSDEKAMLVTQAVTQMSVSKEQLKNITDSKDFLKKEIDRYHDVKAEKINVEDKNDGGLFEVNAKTTIPHKIVIDKEEETETKIDSNLSSKKISSVVQEKLPKGEKTITIKKEMYVVDPKIMHDIQELDNDIKFKITQAKLEADRLDRDKSESFVRENFTIQTKVIDKIIPVSSETETITETELVFEPKTISINKKEESDILKAMESALKKEIQRYKDAAPEISEREFYRLAKMNSTDFLVNEVLKYHDVKPVLTSKEKISEKALIDKGKKESSPSQIPKKDKKKGSPFKIFEKKDKLDESEKFFEDKENSEQRSDKEKHRKEKREKRKSGGFLSMFSKSSESEDKPEPLESNVLMDNPEIKLILSETTNFINTEINNYEDAKPILVTDLDDFEESEDLKSGLFSIFSKKDKKADKSPRIGKKLFKKHKKEKSEEIKNEDVVGKTYQKLEDLDDGIDKKIEGFQKYTETQVPDSVDQKTKKVAFTSSTKGSFDIPDVTRSDNVKHFQEQISQQEHFHDYVNVKIKPHSEDTTDVIKDLANHSHIVVDDIIIQAEKKAYDIQKERFNGISQINHSSSNFADEILESFDAKMGEVREEIQNNGVDINKGTNHNKDAFMHTVDEKYKETMELSKELASKVSKHKPASDFKTMDKQKINNTIRERDEQAQKMVCETFQDPKSKEITIVQDSKKKSSSFLSKLGNKISGKSKSLEKNVEDGFNKVKSDVEEARDKVKEEYDKKYSIATIDAETMNQHFEDPGTKFYEKERDLVEKTKQNANETKSKIKEVNQHISENLNDAKKKTTGFFSKLGDKLSGKSKGLETDVKDVVTESTSQFYEEKDDVLNSVIVLDKKTDTLVKTGDKGVDKLKEECPTTKQEANRKVDDMVKKAAEDILSSEQNTNINVDTLNISSPEIRQYVSDLDQLVHKTNDKMQQAAQDAMTDIQLSAQQLDTGAIYVKQDRDLFLQKEKNKLREQADLIKIDRKDILKTQIAKAASEDLDKLPAAKQDQTNAVVASVKLTSHDNIDSAKCIKDKGKGEVQEKVNEISEKLKEAKKKSSGILSKIGDKMSGKVKSVERDTEPLNQATKEGKESDENKNSQETNKVSETVEKEINKIEKQIAGTGQTEEDLNDDKKRTTEFFSKMGFKISGGVKSAEKEIKPAGGEVKINQFERDISNSLQQKKETVLVKETEKSEMEGIYTDLVTKMKINVSDKVNDSKYGTENKALDFKKNLDETVRIKSKGQQETVKGSVFLTKLNDEIEEKATGVEKDSDELALKEKTKLKERIDEVEKTIKKAHDELKSELVSIQKDAKDSTSEFLKIESDLGEMTRTVSDYGGQMRKQESGRVNISEANIDLSNLPADSESEGKQNTSPYVSSPILSRRTVSQRLTKEERPDIREVTHGGGFSKVIVQEITYTVTEPEDFEGQHRKPLFHLESEEDDSLLQKSKKYVRSDSAKSNIVENLSESALETLLSDMATNLDEATRPVGEPINIEIIKEGKKLKMHVQESTSDLKIIEKKLYDFDKALGSLEESKAQDDCKTKKLKRVERKFERLASEVLEKHDGNDHQKEMTLPEVEQRGELDFQKLVSQISVEDVSDYQKEYGHLWDETTFSKSGTSDWESSKTPDSQADALDLPKGSDQPSGSQQAASPQAEVEESSDKDSKKSSDQHQLSDEMKALLKEMEKEAKQ